MSEKLSRAVQRLLWALSGSCDRAAHTSAIAAIELYDGTASSEGGTVGAYP